jgi:formylglycine-generating enzyme required for sulfatase activity
LGLYVIFLVHSADQASTTLIPSGSYFPLYSTEKKGIEVQAFRLDTFPVTRKDFLDFVERNKHWRRSKAKNIFADLTYLRDWSADLDPGFEQDLKSPVRFVSWFAARAYCESRSMRLPTVAEWERAASAFSKVSDVNAQILAWYSQANFKRWPKVGLGQKNDFGVYDLHGLIWEWVEDFNSSLVTGESRADSSPDQSKFCGAGVLSASDAQDYAAFMRYGFRSSLRGNFALANLGFRCATDASITPKGAKK